MKMKRINVFVSEDTLDVLKDYPGTISEHTRRALSEYSVKLLRVSTSPTIIHEEITETYYTEGGDSNDEEEK